MPAHSSAELSVAPSAAPNTRCYHLRMGERAGKGHRAQASTASLVRPVPDSRRRVVAVRSSPEPREEALGAPSLKERKLSVVRAALNAAAEELFVSRGFEQTTVAEIARAAGVSRRTFFRYYESKEDVIVERSDRLADDVLAILAKRPLDDPPLIAIRHAIVPALESALAERELVRCAMRLIRETSALRRAMMERRNRMEERLTALLARRLGVDAASDNTPMLLAFLTRALLDTAVNAWFDHETDDVAALVDDLLVRLRFVVETMPADRAQGLRPARRSSARGTTKGR